MPLNKVKKIEIEVFSRCNRKCNWCPNVAIDRFTQDIPMNENCYLQLLNDLKKGNFKGEISFSRYNEPTQNHKLLKTRINQAREIFPKNYMFCNTNGDYLRKSWGKEILDGLYLNELNIMDYDCKGIEHGKELFNKLNIQIISKKNLPEKYQHDWKLIGKTKTIGLIHFYADWPKHNHLENRGGFFTDLSTGKIQDVVANYGDAETRGTIMKWKKGAAKRKKPCYLPTTNINIDYNGVVNPCCHIRSDNPRHKEFGLGNINNNSIIDIYNSKKAKEFRALLASKKWENYPTPCKLCTKGESI
jgi:radical SAM protein with 4Fe4S-binding SPASM domain